MEKYQHTQIPTTLLTTSVAIIIIVIIFLLAFPASFSGNGNSSAGNSFIRSYFSLSSERLRSVSTPRLLAGKQSPPHRTSLTKTKEEEKRKRKKAREVGLARARAAIRTQMAWNSQNKSSIYRNPRAFHKSYLEMEKRFKVYTYSEGEAPIVHDGPCKDIYSIEGRFIHEMEHGAKRFNTKDPNNAHVYFMPFSVAWMVKYLYNPVMTYNVTPIRNFVLDYVNIISTKYSFWNETQGADHFMLACHDWGPSASKGNANLYGNSIRVLCNANSSEGFVPQKDVSLPEIHLYDGNVSPKLLHPSSIAPTPRPYIAFFAGGLHGPTRPILLKHWMNETRDPLIQVHEYLPKNLDYYTFMLNSKFCLCPSGYEVASPRVVEAIYAECVPVIVSKNYVLPFSDVLRWEAFSIKVDVDEIPKLKEILEGVSDEKYRKLVQGVKDVRKHFVLNKPAKRFDVFHMILHSVWLRRLNLKLR